METCLFCEIIKGTIPSQTIFENDKVVAFLDIHPANPGHILVVTKEHYNSYLETPIDILTEVNAAIQKITPAILKSVGAEAFNIIVNSGRDAGQIIFHLHWHIIPRFADDGHRHWKGRAEYEDGLAMVAEKIKNELGQ